MRGSDLARSIDMEYRKKRRMETKSKNKQHNNKNNTYRKCENEKRDVLNKK